MFKIEASEIDSATTSSSTAFRVFLQSRLEIRVMPTPVDIERFYDIQELTDIAVAPDGERVAFIAQECDPIDDERRSALYIVSADGSDEPYRLTRASTATCPRWSPDGNQPAFLAQRDDDLSLKAGRHEDENGNEDSPEEEPKPQGLGV